MRKQKIKSGWQEYFNFSARERRGNLLLTLLLMMQIIVMNILHNYESPPQSLDPELVRAVVAWCNRADTKSIENSHSQPVFHPVSFDPNSLDSLTALTAGISSRQLRVINNFLSKGGKFRTKNDFSKMYCIPPEQFAKLKPYLLLPDSLQRSAKSFTKKKFMLELSTADSIALENLPRIGPVFASRIVKYREKLGGFCSKEQLKEVYGMNDSLFDFLEQKIVLNDSVPFRFIHLATDSLPALASHPYIRWKLASMIISYRNQHPIRSIEDIASLPLITEENFRKLAPYLKPD